MFLKVMKKVPMGWPLAGEEQNVDDVAIKVAVMWVKSERYMETGWRRPDPGGTGVLLQMTIETQIRMKPDLVVQACNPLNPVT